MYKKSNYKKKTPLNFTFANQLAFRRHYQKMVFRESRGEIQWQRAVANTVRIMKKAGVSQREISESTPILMVNKKNFNFKNNLIFLILIICNVLVRL